MLADRFTLLRRPGAFALAMIPAILLVSCEDATRVEPVFNGEIMAVIAGRITDREGVPVPGAVVFFSYPCPGMPSTCTTSTAILTDEAGRFVAVFEETGTPLTTRAEVTARPPIGRGYVLGQTTIAGLKMSFQPAPAADTTFAALSLPSNHSESRRPVWVQEISFRALTRPLKADAEHVYFSSPGGVAALDRESGEYLWQEGSAPGLVGLPYALVDGIVVMARDEVLSALRSSDGELLWTRHGDPNLALTTTEEDGLFATDGESIAAYDHRTGAIRWENPLQPGGRVAMAAGEGLVCVERLVVSPAFARIECWSVSDGEPRWSRFIGLSAWHVITGGRVVLAGGETERERGWIGLDLNTGETIWKSALPPAGDPVISAGGQTLYACSSHGSGTPECLAVRVADGTIAWRRSLEEEVSPAAIGEGALYVLQRGPLLNPLLVLDPGSGVVRERIDADPLDEGSFCGTPAAGDDMVFVFGCHGYIYAFRVDP